MREALRRAVFLDRDGVLNRAVVTPIGLHPPATLAEMEIFPDAPAALATLKAAGYLLIGATNQPDVARGTQSHEVVEAINATLLSKLQLDDIFTCYHDDADNCTCRKPRPGLLLQAAARYGIDLAVSFMIGDRWKDVEAGRKAGCTTILIDHGYTEPRHECRPSHTVHSLAQAAEWIIEHGNQAGGIK